jgi:hypothetical protein
METSGEDSCYRIQVVANAKDDEKCGRFWLNSKQLTMSIAEGGGGRVAMGTGTRRCC